MRTATAAKTEGFRNLLSDLWVRNRFGCIEFNADPRNEKIVDATIDLVLAYSFNIASFKALGPEGVNALRHIITFIQGRTPFLPIMLGGEHTDIENKEAYAYEVFDSYGVDAVSAVSSSLGAETLNPFLARPDKGIFILCRTSNFWADRLVYIDTDELQSLLPDEKLNTRFPNATGGPSDKPAYLVPLYQLVVLYASHMWNNHHNCGLAADATPQKLMAIRRIAPEMPILVTVTDGLNGNLKETVKAGMNKFKQGIIVNVPSNVIAPPSEPDFARAARTNVQRLTKAINEYRAAES